MFPQLGCFIKAMQWKASERATIGEDLHKAVATSADEAEKVKQLEMRLKEEEVRVHKLKTSWEKIKAELDHQERFIDKAMRAFLDFKNFLVEGLRYVRLYAGRDFLNSTSFKFLTADKSDAARLEGFVSAIGQLQSKGLLPPDFDWKAEGLIPSADANGVEVPVDSVSDEQLAACEFVELVTNEGEIEIQNGGPFLPRFVPEALLKVGLVPFDDYRAFLQKWFALPIRVLDLPADFDLFAHAQALAAEATNRPEAEEAGPSQTGA